MSDFCGFDLDRVPALQRAIGSAATDANGLSSAVATTVDQANEYVALGLGLSQKQLGTDWGSADTDPDRVALRTITTSAPDIVSDIGRRLAHLQACHQLALDGFKVDPNHVFDDAPPPNENKIKAALAQVKSALDGKYPHGNSGALASLLKTIRGLNGAESEAFVGGLSADELSQLNDALKPSVTTHGRLDFSFNGLSNNDRISLANALLGKLSLDQVKRLMAGVPVLEPSLNGTDNNTAWYAWLNASLFGSGGKPSLGDINQGSIGDCWLLSTIGAELQHDPNFVNEHLHDNGNGTYTVTFYTNGKAVPVTVDGALPQDGGAGMPFVHGSHDSSVNGPTWIAIYEKAYAQYVGGYSSIKAGTGSEGINVLTGQPASGHSVGTGMLGLPTGPSLDKIKAQLAAGKAVTAGTADHGGNEFTDGGKVVQGHCYRVQSVEDTPQGPVIVLVNPWGSASKDDYIIKLPPSEFYKYFNEVYY